MIKFNDVTFKYDNQIVLQNISLNIEEGIFLGLIGPNGGGKTTFLRLILGLLKGYAGEIKVFNRTPINLKEIRQNIGYYPQKQNVNWDFPISVWETVLLGTITKTPFFKRIKAEDKDYALQLLNKLNILDYKDRPISQLSGGQQQKVFLARALISKPRLVILDEPTANLDTTSQLNFSKQLLALKEEFKLSVIMVSHDVNSLVNNADKIVCLNKKIHFCDKTELLTEEMITHTYTCELETYKHNRQELHGIYHD
ncbi:MAG: metal ABC transporter ATP-binding protein [Spirochaetota bacterium]|nr:metal ABC transporter ATP-binding protein [Spirochaetota bacterium]